MGTRSVVAVATGDQSWRGRYIHWDGYPEGVGTVLHGIIKRDGRDLAVKTLTEDHRGWSSLTAEPAPDNSGLGDERSVAVPGYGVAYSDDEQPDEWITDVSIHESWCEFAYVIQKDGSIKPYSIQSSGLTLLPTDADGAPLPERG